MFVLVFAFCIVFFAIAIVAFVLITEQPGSKKKDSDKPKKPPAPSPVPGANMQPSDDPPLPKPTVLENSFEPTTAVHLCYENQNSGTLIRMKPDMEKFDQFVKLMNESRNKSTMIVGPVSFTDSTGKKRTSGYELRMKVNAYDTKIVKTLTLIPKTFTGNSYKVNLFDYVSIMLYPIGNEDCEYDLSKHFGGENRLQRSLLKFYVRHITSNSGYKKYYANWDVWNERFTIVDDVNYSDMFQIKDASGSFVNFPSGNQDIFYKGIELPDDTLEIRKANVPASMKTMIFIVRTTYAGYGQSNIPFIHGGVAPGQYPVSLDTIVQLNL